MTVAALLFGIAGLGLLAMGPPGEPLPDEGPPRQLEAVRTNETMTIDGQGLEPIWSSAPVADGFEERTPDLGATPPFRTTFQVVYDDNNLYCLVHVDMPPDLIRVRTLQRDSFEIFSDSTIALKLDPYLDRRSSMQFAVNADGAQIDVLALEDGRVAIREWDAVWAAETVIRDDGYDVEFKIPFAVLGIKGGEDFTMGLNITRDEPTVNATYDWRVIVPPRSPFGASGFGELGGLRNIRPQRALEFTPFVTAGTDFEPVFRLDPRRRPNLSAGADARVQVGQASYVEASVLTDFAQVEADQVQVANDRFPLFFPERRPFFINGLDVFNFGRPREAQLFFSRRIGLDGGFPTPIAGGAKSYGRAGPVSYGVLNVQTLRQLPRADEFAESEGIPPENFTVARLRVQTGKYASFGVLGAGKHRFGDPGHDAFSGGLDGELRALEGKLRTYAFIASTYAQIAAVDPTVDESGRVSDLGRPQDEQVGGSAHALVEYQGLYVRPSFVWLWSDEQFTAPLGFYTRPGTAVQRGELRFAPRPGVLGLRDVQFGPRGSLTTTPDYDAVLTRDMGGFVGLNWNRGWGLNYSVNHLNDDVQRPFTLYGMEVGADRYYGFSHSVSGSTPGREMVSASATYQYAQRFGGERHAASLSANLRLSKHFTMSGNYTHLVGHLADPTDRFNFGFLNGTVLFAVNRNIVWDNLVRFSLAPGDERIGLQSRFRWRYRPGSDLFLVYRNDIPLESTLPNAPVRERFHALTLKVSFYLRALLRA